MSNNGRINLCVVNEELKISLGTYSSKKKNSIGLGRRLNSTAVIKKKMLEI